MCFVAETEEERNLKGRGKKNEKKKQGEKMKKKETDNEKNV